jgi:hypothetical protein
VRAYLICGLTLVALIVAAGLLKSLLEKRNVRPPVDFLPASASVVTALDLRPEGSSLLRWPAEDRQILADRAVQMAQRVVDGTGLELDLRETASHWFGGQLVVASFRRGEAIPVGPRSLLLIAAVTDTRRARGDMDQAVARLGREAGWERERARSDGQAIVVWGEPGRRSEMAYAAVDGCLILSADLELVELSLAAAGDPGRRLVEQEEFREVLRPLPDDRFLWCYANTTDLLPIVRSLGPALSDGWVGFMRAYFTRRIRPGSSGEASGDRDESGRLAFALAAETDGLRVHANYWQARRRELASPAAESSDIVYFAPPETAALLLVHGLPDLVSLLSPESGPSNALPGMTRSLLARTLRGLLACEQVPDSVLLTVARQEDGDKGPTLAGAFAGAGSVQAAERLADLLPDGRSVDVDGFALFASGDEGLRRLKQAAKLPKERYEMEADVRVFVRARPAAAWPALGWLSEVSLTIRDDASGGHGELYLKGEPRRLLGQP